MVTSNLPKRFEEVQRLNLQFAQREQELHSAHVQECALLQSALVKAEATVTKLTNQLVSHHAEIEQLRNEHKNVASEHSSVSKNLAESIALVDALRSHLEAQQSTIDDTQAEIKLKAIAAASLRDEHESALKTIAERHQAEISGVLAEKQTSLLASDEKVSALAA